jgi:heme/copper-type cytochrome/quinol oxidase subunit 3
MSDDPQISATLPHAGAEEATARPKHATVTPGKVAMWLFLGTEIMFFTGLIGTYVVLRAGSSPTSYSNIRTPADPAVSSGGLVGLLIDRPGPQPEAVAKLIRPIMEKHANYDEHDLEHLVEAGHAVLPGLAAAETDTLAAKLSDLGAHVEKLPLKAHPWPLPYDNETNPLSIDLTAFNTFILICSSVTMVLSLAAVQKGDRKRMILFLAATLGIGGVFLGIQAYEYYSLYTHHVYPLGISADGHFRPSSSLFGSCFYTMTGFHGAHVAGGLVALLCLLIGALLGKFNQANHASIEMVGLYWHFVDLVWIILFTVVYLL